ncbi:glycosyltransferase [Aquabacterium sp. J223]|uniref:glycosyltransferase n=1 Tax=Aquabacterium sp. J223 TaxID=2898431 RepID=UPI00289911CE|nr:glycosyltransferase [Aquabacterium sp. J223]
MTTRATPPPRPTLDLVYFDAGGGHRATAQALQQVLHQQRRPWRVRTLHLLKVLDAPTGERFYNLRLARGWTLGLSQELRVLQQAIRLAHPLLVKRLVAHWCDDRPDLVVSLVPNFNRCMAEALAQVHPPAPLVTVMTDLADHPPAFWMEPGGVQHLVCGSPRALQQARALDHPPERLHSTSGMVIRPGFYAPPVADRAGERLRQGLDPFRPTVLVLFGGHGSRRMLDIARRLGEAGLQQVLVCGHNAALAQALQALPATSAPRRVLGYTQDVPYWMDLADVFVGKPGPGSISEALQRGLPVVVERNAWTMPQERYNADWVQDQGVGVVVDNFREVAPAVRRVLDDRRRFAAAVARQENRALHEVPEILADLLQAGSWPQRPPNAPAVLRPSAWWRPRLAA